MTYAFPPALPHGALREVLPNLFFVTGTIGISFTRFSRSMTVVREGQRLILVNTVRLDDEGLRALDALGTVTDVIRIAAFHGMDDPFYAHRYNAKVWAPKGQVYGKGFDTQATPYFTATNIIDVGAPATNLPITGARMTFFSTSPPEALLWLDMHGGVLISGDSLQNMVPPWDHFNTAGKIVMRLGGFLKPANVGPAWASRAKPLARELRAVLDTPFEAVFPAHGVPITTGARDLYRPTIERVAARMP